jgi:hypothetical protein
MPWPMVTRWVTFTRWVTISIGLIIPIGTMIIMLTWRLGWSESGIEGVGRADAEGPAVTEVPRTIFYFLKI